MSTKGENDTEDQQEEKTEQKEETKQSQKQAKADDQDEDDTDQKSNQETHEYIEQDEDKENETHVNTTDEEQNRQNSVSNKNESDNYRQDTNELVDSTTLTKDKKENKEFESHEDVAENNTDDIKMQDISDEESASKSDRDSLKNDEKQNSSPQIADKQKENLNSNEAEEKNVPRKSSEGTFITENEAVAADDNYNSRENSDIADDEKSPSRNSQKEIKSNDAETENKNGASSYETNEQGRLTNKQNEDKENENKEETNHDRESKELSTESNNEGSGNKDYFYISTPRKIDNHMPSEEQEKDENVHENNEEIEEIKNREDHTTTENSVKADVSQNKQKKMQEYSDDEFETASGNSDTKSEHDTHETNKAEEGHSRGSQSIPDEDASEKRREATPEPIVETKKQVYSENKRAEAQDSSTDKHQTSNQTEKSDVNQTSSKTVEFNKTNKIESDENSDKQEVKTEKRHNDSPRHIMANEKQQQRKTAKSAEVQRSSSRASPRRIVFTKPRPKTTGQRSVHSTSYSIGKKRNSKRGKSFTNKNKKQAKDNTETGSDGSEAGRRKQKEFFKEELRRLQNGLQTEKSKIHKPKERDYYPYVFTSLEPYYNTYVASYLIELADDKRHPFITRNTAQGLCDPWVDLRMDHEILPKLDTGSKPSTTTSQRPQKKKGSSKKDRPTKEGSTRLPKFPVVNFNAGKENATKKFPYSEIPQFREEMKDKFSQNATHKVDQDYNRTKQDFYRMELDKIDEIHPINRPHMRKAYFAYLQNTPGSRKAIKECAKTLPA